MKAVINLDVPEWQIGQPVSVYFPDTMQKRGVCELLKEQEAKLLTFDEVKRHYSIPGELLGDIKKYVDYSEDIDPLYLECNIEDEWVVHWRRYCDIALHLDQWKEDYGKTWRCWTAKPTLAQRREMKWK